MASVVDRAGTPVTVLAVEDDDDVRAIAVLSLSEAGYRVLEAANGDLAMPILAGEDRIDLLFSDVVMPGETNGFALARRAVALRPNLKILLTTGYAEQIQAHEALVARGELMPKPYRVGELVDRVTRHLGSMPAQLNRVLFRLLDYWRSRCTDRSCPQARDIHAADLVDIAGHLTIVDVIGSPPDLTFRYRSVGQELASIFGVELTGKLVGDASPQDHRQFMIGLYREAAVRRLPVYSATGYSYRGETHPPAPAGLSTERLFLPLTDEAGKVTEVLCGQTFDWTSRGDTVSYVLHRTLGRKDTVERVG